MAGLGPWDMAPARSADRPAPCRVVFSNLYTRSDTVYPYDVALNLRDPYYTQLQLSLPLSLSPTMTCITGSRQEVCVFQIVVRGAIM